MSQELEKHIVTLSLEIADLRARLRTAAEELRVAEDHADQQQQAAKEWKAAFMLLWDEYGEESPSHDPGEAFGQAQNLLGRFS